MPFASRKDRHRRAAAIREESATREPDPPAEPPLASRVLPAGTAGELIAKLADAIGQPVAIACDLTGTTLVAHPREGVVEADPPADLTLPDEQAETLRRQAAAMHAAAAKEKAAAMAELAAGAGHEVNNPLGTILGRAGQLLLAETDPQRRRSLAQIAAEARRGRDMIGDLMLIGRPPEPAIESVAVAAAIDEVVAEFADDLAARSLHVAGSRDREATVAADRTQLAIVLSELLRNAIRFAPEGSAIRIAVAKFGRVRIEVEDDGPGFDAVVRRHLFDPYFSGRQAGRGHGFGLCKCHRIVSRHGGRIAAAEQPTRFVIDWPAG